MSAVKGQTGPKGDRNSNNRWVQPWHAEKHLLTITLEVVCIYTTQPLGTLVKLLQCCCIKIHFVHLSNDNQTDGTSNKEAFIVC